MNKYNFRELRDEASVSHWYHEDGTITSVGDMVFYEPSGQWLMVDEITMEPITGDPDELVHEPIFWCSPKDISFQHHFSESEIKGLDNASI